MTPDSTIFSEVKQRKPTHLTLNPNSLGEGITERTK